MLDLNEIEAHGLYVDMDVAGGGRSAGPKKDGEEQQRVPPRLGSMKLSSDQKMVACTIDMEGTDRFLLAVFYLGGGEGDEGGARSRLVLRDDGGT